MGKNWWLTWTKVGVILLVLAVIYGILHIRMKKTLSVYLTDAPENAKIYEKYDYQKLIFDIANEYALTIIEESDAERNAVTTRLS